MRKILIYILIVIPVLVMGKNNKAFTPGTIWPDNNGIHINAHGGGILFYGGKYYWFGEHKLEGKKGNQAWVGVHCYSSKDLYKWKDEGISMKVSEDANSPVTAGCVIERPKVLYNPKTGKFVMWFHLELKAKGYSAAKTGVAVSDMPAGPYNFIRAENPNADQWPVDYPEMLKTRNYPENLKSWSDEWLTAIKEGMFIRRDFSKGQMSRDMALFLDNDGKAYHIHASEENLTLHISELTEDFLGFSGKYIRILPTGYNEAPAIFKRNGKYFMITSGCTGWAPNAARLLTADSIMGNWKYLENPCIGNDRELTFHSQSTFILPLHGKKDSYIFMADRWTPNNAIDGRYIWLPLQFNDKGNPYIKWKDKWDLGFFR